MRAFPGSRASQGKSAMLLYHRETKSGRRGRSGRAGTRTRDPLQDLDRPLAFLRTASKRPNADEEADVSPGS